MNIHHLELFFHVARHGGISAAVRRMPYGIQQPAISSQILQLEDDLGVSLFVRRPFALTAEGRLLYDFIAPFFSGADEMEQRLRGGVVERLRIAAPIIVQQEYLPELFARMKRKVPEFLFTLRQQAAADGNNGGDFEVSLEFLRARPSAGHHCRELAKLPLVLLTVDRHATAADFWRGGRGTVPLIALPKNEAIHQVFHAELRQREIAWPTALELGSLDLVARYVAAGYGVGLAVRLPGMKLPRGVRKLALPDFPQMTFAAVWTGPLPPLGKLFVDEAGRLARELFGG